MSNSKKREAESDSSALVVANDADNGHTVNSFVITINEDYQLHVPTLDDLLPGTLYNEMWNLSIEVVEHPSPNVLKMATATTNFPQILPQLGARVFIQVRQAPITSISAANPTVIASAAHGLSTGNIIIIAGSNSTPVIDGEQIGEQIVTVLSVDTFTIPVAVTKPGTTGTWTRLAKITGISVANPTVITSTAHGLSTGDAIVIAGSDSTPSIGGVRVVTRLTADTFTVPVPVTTAGTSGTWIRTRANPSS